MFKRKVVLTRLYNSRLRDTFSVKRFSLSISVLYHITFKKRLTLFAYFTLRFSPFFHRARYFSS